jgi:hypothetical protein
MWASITAFYAAHPTLSTLGAYYVFSAIVSGMPDPDTTSSKGYLWLFKTLHLLAADWGAGLSSKLPPPPPPLPPGVGTATLK